MKQMHLAIAWDKWRERFQERRLQPVVSVVNLKLQHLLNFTQTGGRFHFAKTEEPGFLCVWALAFKDTSELLQIWNMSLCTNGALSVIACTQVPCFPQQGEVLEGLAQRYASSFAE